MVTGKNISVTCNKISIITKFNNNIDKIWPILGSEAKYNEYVSIRKSAKKLLIERV